MQADTHKIKIFGICGSTRPGSSNEKILEQLALRCRDTADFEIWKALGTLPHFSPGTGDEQLPLPVMQFLSKIEAADAVLICTPEYVFSMPGSLKNALEWTVSSVVFSYKPVAYIVASSLGEETFVSLDRVVSTLTQEPIPPELKLLLSGGRTLIDGLEKPATDKTAASLTRLLNELIHAVKLKQA